MVKFFEIFSTSSQNSAPQHPMVTCVPNLFFPKKFGTCTRNGSFGVFWMKT